MWRESQLIHPESSPKSAFRLWCQKKNFLTKPCDENPIARSSNPTWLLTNVVGWGLKRPASCSVPPHLGRTRDSAAHHRKSPDSVKLPLFKTCGHTTYPCSAMKSFQDASRPVKHPQQHSNDSNSNQANLPLLLSQPSLKSHPGTGLSTALVAWSCKRRIYLNVHQTSAPERCRQNFYIINGIPKGEYIYILYISYIFIFVNSSLHHW